MLKRATWTYALLQGDNGDPRELIPGGTAHHSPFKFRGWSPRVTRRLSNLEPPRVPVAQGGN